MFYIVKEMRSEPTAQIARDLDRDYETVLNFVHKVQDVSGDIDEFDLYDVCEADEIYVTVGEKDLEDEEGIPRSRGLSKRGAETSSQTNRRSWHSSVGMTDEFAFWFVMISKTPTKTSPSTVMEASFFADEYTIYDDIDEFKQIDAHLAITHDDTYVIGDAHINTCENRHSFFRQRLARFGGVSKHHLQK